MEEIKINQAEVNIPKPIEKKEEKQEPSLADKVDTLWYEANNIIKKKPLKLPRKAKTRKRKAKKGWVGIVRVDENNVASGEKVLLRDASFITKKDGLIHATDGREMIWWDGKFPVFFQESKKNNPKNFRWNQGGNETYGQPYIRAKMLLEAVKLKKGGLSIILILAAIAVGIFLVNKFLSGG